MIAPVPSETSRSIRDCFVSVVLPLYNEVAILRELTEKVIASMDGQHCAFEIIFVNDGSSDGSTELLDELSTADARIRVLHFSRNFGHQAAVHAGLVHAEGDVVVVMDSDMQDNPRAIPGFLEAWQQGYDVVYAERTNRKESLLKRFLFKAFYRILNDISDTRIPRDAGNFGLLDRSVVDCVLSIPDQDRYFPGLRSWVGFRQTGIPVERDARHDDNPRVSLRGLFRLAKSAVFSFSVFPLTFFHLIAIVSAAVCTCSIAYAMYHKLFTGAAIPGWSSTIIMASLFGSLNALGISVLGEYVIRIYDQVRQRPLYVVARISDAQSGRQQSEAGHSKESAVVPEQWRSLLTWLDATWNREGEQDHTTQWADHLSAVGAPTLPIDGITSNDGRKGR